LDVAEIAGGGFEDLLESIEDAREGAERVRALVSDLMLLSRGDDQTVREIQVEPLLESVIKTLWGEISTHARLVCTYEPVATVRANPTQLTQVFLKALTGAIQALSIPPPAGGKIQVSISRSGESGVLVEVWDNGSRIEPEPQRCALDPIYTDASLGSRGSTLGLSACRTLIAEMGGAITLESRVGGGSIFRIALPAVKQERPPRRAITVPTERSIEVQSG
jgi:signal transduction histidine kinase